MQNVCSQKGGNTKEANLSQIVLSQMLYKTIQAHDVFCALAIVH